METKVPAGRTKYEPKTLYVTTESPTFPILHCLKQFAPPPPVKPSSSTILRPERLPQGTEEPAAESFSWPIIGRYNWQLVFSLPTFLSRSGSLKVSRNFLTCSERRRSMLRASMARPRNSSTSSSGFRFSCVFLKMKCLNNTRLHKVMLTCGGDTEGSQESAETFFLLADHM